MSISPEVEPQAPFTTGAGYLLSQLGRMAEREWTTAIGAAGLTQSEYTVLAVLAEEPGIAQRDLARRVGQDPRNTVATVAGLTERQLVRAATDPADRRRKMLSISAGGRRAMSRLARSLARDRADFLAPLDDAEQEQLRTLLLRVHRHQLSR